MASATVLATLSLGAITTSDDRKTVTVAGTLADTNWIEVWQNGKRLTKRAAVQIQGAWSIQVAVPGPGDYEARLFSAASGGTAIIKQVFTVPAVPVVVQPPVVTPPVVTPPVVTPPVVTPPATGTGKVALENASPAAMPAGVATFGYVFAAGQMPAGSTVAASANGAAIAAQMDVKASWPDGSVKMAVLSVARPALAPGASADVALGATTTAAALPISVPTGLAGTIRVAFTDGTALILDPFALARSSADFWMRGPLAVSARVTAAHAASAFRVVADVVIYAGGSYALDIQFANDRAMEAAGGHLDYTAIVTLNGAELLRETVSQRQYAVWRRRIGSASDGGQGVGGLNVRHDTTRLEAMFAVPRTDRAVASAVNWSWVDAALADPAFGKPLAANGVMRYMPGPGGRGDIGPTTASNALWLLTGDPRAARLGLAQADAGGACPWNMWDAAQGTWLNAGRYPRLWVDQRGGTGTPGDTSSGGLTQQVEWNGYDDWTPETAHQPDLAFVPYVLTGERWLLDRLLAQAAWNTIANWPGDASMGERYNRETQSWNLVVNNVQPRAAAWAARQLENAAWAAPDNSPEKAFFRGYADANWRWLANRRAEWGAAAGEAQGYHQGVIWGRDGRVSPWEQDYLILVAAWAAGRGQADARAYLAWASSFTLGRFEQADGVFPAKDGVAITIQPSMVDGSGNLVFYKTWAEVGRATYAAGQSNTDPAHAPGGWDRSQGNFSIIALTALAEIDRVLGGRRARAARDRLLGLNPPFVSAQDRAGEIQFCSAIVR